MINNDLYIKGILPELNIKFLFVKLKNSLEEIDHLQNFSLQCKTLLGEVLAGTILLTGKDIKESHEIISIQIESSSYIKKILTFASPTGEIRGIIVPPHAQWDTQKSSGLGVGVLQVNKYAYNTKKVYSSAVELQSKSFEANLFNYIQKSEQTNTFIKIFSDSQEQTEVYAYIFEPLPETSFEQIEQVADFLYQMDSKEFFLNIFRTYDENKKFVKKFNVKFLQINEIFFRCNCNTKIENLIFSLGENEIYQILQEEGVLEITCEFCKKKYTYTESDIKKHFFR